MGHTCGEPNETGLTPMGVELNGSQVRRRVEHVRPSPADQLREHDRVPRPAADSGLLRYASRAVQFHPDGGQVDFVWLPARTMHPHGAHVWRARRNQEKCPPDKCYRSFGGPGKHFYGDTCAAACKTGYAGSVATFTCGIDSKWAADTKPVRCVDVDECLTDGGGCDAKSGAKCVNTPGASKCECTIKASTLNADGRTCEAPFDTVRVASRSIPPPWGSIRFRLAPRTYDAPPCGPSVRVVSLTKSRKIPTRNILPLFFVLQAVQFDASSGPTKTTWKVRAP